MIIFRSRAGDILGLFNPEDKLWVDFYLRGDGTIREHTMDMYKIGSRTIEQIRQSYEEVDDPDLLKEVLKIIARHSL